MSKIMNDQSDGFEEKKIAKRNKSNFLYSFWLLSREKNDAINTVYAFCRETDDIVDDENDSWEQKYSRIIEWRNEFEKALINGDSKYTLLNSVNKIIRKFSIPVEPF